MAEKKAADEQGRTATTISIDGEAKEMFDAFKNARGQNQKEAFKARIQIAETQGFAAAHPDHKASLEAIDELTQKLRTTVEGAIIAGEEAAEKAKASAARDVEAFKAQADAAAEKVEELQGRIPELDRTIAELNERRKADSDELEKKQDEMKEAKNQAEIDRAARDQAKTELAIAEKDKAKAEAEAAKAKAELDAFKEKSAHETKLASAKAEAELNAALREAEVVRASAEKDVAAAKEAAAKAEGRAEALAADIARIRDERNEARAGLAAAQAEVKAKEEQVAMLERLLNIAEGGAVQKEKGSEEEQG